MPGRSRPVMASRAEVSPGTPRQQTMGGAESLPIVCGHCKRPLRYSKRWGLLDKETKRPHFLADVCIIAIGLDQAMRATQMAQERRRMRP